MKSRKPEDNVEEQLSLELENLYKEIDRPDKIEKIGRIDSQTESEPDLAPAYELFKVGPDATHEELKKAYEELAAAWNPKRFTDHPEWKEKAEQKLEIINKAYEAILSSRIREIRKKRKSIQLGEIEKDIDPSYAGDIEEDREEYRPRRFGLKHALIFAGIPIFLLLCWFLVSPLFEQPLDNIKPAEEKNLPFARNVLPAPVPESKPEPKPIMTADIKADEKPGMKAENYIQTPAAKEAPAPRPVPKAAPPRPAPAAVKSVPESKPQPPKAAPKAETAKKSGSPASMPFSIQVGAVKDRAKGEEYLGKVRKDGLNASLVETTLPSGERGYRILVGGFQTREEAFAYMNSKGLQRRYPGSFIQKKTR